MPLRLAFPDKYRLWSDLIQGNTDRVFVSTDESPKIGARVPVELTLPGLPAHIVIVGTVIGLRVSSDRFPAGAFVRFPDEEIDKARRFLGLSQSPERYEQGRKTRRARCALPLVFKQPPLADPFTVKNISESGLLVGCPLTLIVGQYVQFELTVDEGPPLSLRAEVSRESSGHRQVGLRFLDLPTEAATRIAACVARLDPEPVQTGNAILVADDDTLILEFLSKALAKYGYEVHKSRRGEEALTLVRELKPRLLLLDILMPGIDGVDICKIMRADVEMVDIPVIFLSALKADRLHAIADEAGATDYLTKPVELNDLISLLGKYLKT